MGRLLTLRRNLARLLTRNEVDDNIVNVATDFTGGVDPSTLEGAYVLPFMRWADTSTGWLRRRNVANDAWVNEQRLHRASLAIFDAAEVPSENVGPVVIAEQGYAEWDEGRGGYRVKSGIPVGTVGWWQLRSSLPASQIPSDGQTISRAIFPDLADMVVDGLLPVVTEADWQANPLLRGSYTLGDGSTTIRVPDLNGKSPGTLGAVFRRGDGALSGAIAGQIQRDALQNITGAFNLSRGQGASPSGAFEIVDGASAGSPDYPGLFPLRAVSFNASRVARTAEETRSLNATGFWTIHAFGTVTNPGAADAAQLASDYAVLNAAVQALQARAVDHGQCRFVYVSPTECRLIPLNGNGLIINGKQFRIPQAGVSILVADVTGTAGSYFIYAKADALGVMSLEASATSHARNTDGVEIKTGDPTRSLVGVLFKNSAGEFQHNATIRGVSSWFNRTYQPATYTNFNTGTASATPVQALGNIYVWAWAGETITPCVNGRVATTGAGAASLTFLYVDDVQNWSAGATSATSGANVPVCLNTPASVIEGLHSVSTWLAVSGGTSACALTQSILASP